MQRNYDELADLWYPKTFNKLETKYRQQIENEFNWKLIKTAQKENGRCYICSSLSLVPSGKYYLPFACSNITSKEALLDETYYKVLESILEEHKMFLESDEGDPLNIFFCDSTYDYDNEEDDNENDN